MTLRTRLFLLSFGLLALGASVGLARHDAAAAAARTWPPFVLVAGLLLIGAVAYEDGTFEAAGALLDRVPGGDPMLYAVAMALVAAVTVVLNLDTSVAFLTPVLVGAARRRGASEERLLYGCVFLSNAASLLLPGSNLTNLLVLSGTHVSGSAFLRSMALPWVAAVVVTVAGVALVFRRPAACGPRPDAPGERATLLSIVSIGAAAVLVLALPDAAVPVLVVGLVAAVIRLAQRRLDPERTARAVDVATLGAVFLVATALGTLARAWTFPGHLMRTAGSGQTAAIGAVSSVLANNLPAAVLLGSGTPAHPRSLLFGLNIGPNLAVTGSLSALVWWQAARSVGARPSARRYSLAGLLLAPAAIAAALAVVHLHLA
ncbi:MAG TPA: SLC13 family permease [Actinomycetota bacterium]